MFNFDKEAKWPGLAKVIEETAELSIELSKIVMLQGGTNHWKGNIRPLMIAEIADVLASIIWFVEHNLTSSERKLIELRMVNKTGTYNSWYENGDDPPPVD